MVATSSSPVVALRIDLIEESSLNPRRHFRRLDELAASLKNQQLEAIIVRPHPSLKGRYELADGARRFRAAKVGGLPTLDARVCDLSDGDMLAYILGKGAPGNVDPLTPLEEAEGYSKAMKLMSLTLDDLAQRFSRSLSHVQRVMALLNLPKDARAALEDGTLPERTAFEIARIPGAEKRIEAAKAILHSDVHGGVMPSRAATLYIQKHLCKSLHGAPFNTADAELVREAGSCANCAFRAGNDKDTYGDVKNPHTCMHPSCYEQKVAASRTRILSREAKDGKIALTPEENAAVFAPGEKGIFWKSDFVAWSHSPTRDMLKPEVAKAPAWSELCDGEAKVQVYVGIDQAGIAVDVVKLSEALVAVPRDEVAIFNDAILRRYVIEKHRPDQVPASVDAKKPRGAKARPVARVVEQEQPAPAESWQDRAVRWIAAVLEAVPTLPPKSREDGFQLLREVGASTQTHHVPEVSAVEPTPPPPDVAETQQKFTELKAVVLEAFTTAGIKTSDTRDRITMKTEVHLTATIPAADGMTADKAKTAALVTASQTFRVPLEVVGVKEVAGGFEVTLRRAE